MNPIRILYVTGGVMSRGGIESYMMNYYRNLDRKKIQIDFIVHGSEKGVYDDEIEMMGGKIYNLPVKSKNYIGNIKGLRGIFCTGNYKIVHSHMDAMGMVVLKQAKKCGIPIRIAHSHGTRHLTKNKIKYIFNEYARKKISKYATDLWACSQKAGKWLYGERNDILMVNNAINIEAFKFNERLRDRQRLNMNLKNKFVVGHVGAFYFYKNHEFLLEIFVEILKKNENAVLLLVGQGPLEHSIKEKVNALKLKDKVIFLGQRNDISELMQVMDVLILPSMFEGLPVVIVEAQAASLPSIVSTNVTREVKLSNIVLFEELDSSPNIWAEKALKFNEEGLRKDISNYVKQNGYCIKEEAKKIENIYLNMYKER